MRLNEFAPSPDRDDNGDNMPNQLLVLANRWWNATDNQPRIEHVLNSLGWSIHQVESEDDAVQLQHRDGTTYFISADDFDPDLFEAKKQNTAVAAKLWTAPVKIDQPGYVGRIDVTVTAATMQQARALIKAQYGVKDWHVGSTKQVK
jgi:hypothetical protein